MSLSQIADLLLADQRLTLVDVGAAGGLHSRWQPIRNHLRLIGFEPLDPQSDDGTTLTLPFALGSSERPGELLVTKRVSMTSLLPPAAELLNRFWDKPGHTQIVERLLVELRRLDDLAAQNDFRPDMIKIDVQGGEMDVLAGAEQCLRSSLLAAEIELSFIERYEGLTTFAHVVARMEEWGFELFDLWRVKRYRHRNDAGIVNPGISKGLRAGRLAFCDTLFIRRDADLVEMAATDRRQAAKLIIIALTYGKADVAARFHDLSRGLFDAQANAALDRYFKGLSGRHFGLRGVHRALDYLASKV
ncbi:MAG: FkbM family methyltransferase [Erythrobacter sp.]